MIVIADTTPLISLLKIGKLWLLESLFREILIPQAVYEELTSNSRFYDEALQVENCAFIRRVKVGNIDSVRLLQRAVGIDKGESEAIVYTDECHADLLLVDEAKARQVAKQMGLKIMGTIGILLAAYEKGIIQKEDMLECIDVMRKTGRHISESLYQQLMKTLR